MPLVFPLKDTRKSILVADDTVFLSGSPLAGPFAVHLQQTWQTCALHFESSTKSKVMIPHCWPSYRGEGPSSVWLPRFHR